MKKRRRVEFLTELLILPDGRIYVQNLTQPMADVLHGLNPKDRAMASRMKKARYEFPNRT